ncbi:MAG: MBOAT family protein [Candidatus Omnitrophica bacterium]|nr:MBOAT family protein [Candidatus Omnitrophota bacterium]
MVFNSLVFLLFFLVVYLLYIVTPHKWQNKLLLIAGYVFYSFWDWRFLSLILASTLFNYYFGLKIEEAGSQPRKKAFFILSMVFNIGMLGFFKYFNFFVDNLRVFLEFFGWYIDGVTLNIILPLGISFYTFQAMSYSIDIYGGVIKPTRNFLNFALFISFFPIIEAGPIERARNLIPQIENKRKITLDAFYQGSWLIFWGLYKKILIADNLAKISNAIFSKSAECPGSLLLLAMYAFAFRVYADFSGYSDMARGLARLMGFNIMVNFRAPFFSRNIADLWQRWHISLTTWIKEYLYYPLALAHFFGRQLNAALVIVVTWAIMGFWHGAAWRFVLWGVYHGLIIIIYSKIRPYLRLIKPKNKVLSISVIIAQVLLVFNLFCVGLLFFAVNSTAGVIAILRSILFSFAPSSLMNLDYIVWAFILIVPLLLIEYFQDRRNDEMVVLKWPILARAVVYYILLYSIILYGDFGAQKYFYFQF